MANVIPITQKAASLPVAPNVVGYFANMTTGNLVTTADGRLHLFYFDTAKNLIHAQSLDLGASWTASETLGTTGAGMYDTGYAAFLGPLGELHCAFFDAAHQIIHVMAAASPWNMAGSDTTVHGATPGGRCNLVPAWDGGRLVIAFDNNGPSDPYTIDIVHATSPYTSWTDEGAIVNWGTPQLAALVDRAGGGLLLVYDDASDLETASIIGTWGGTAYSWGNEASEATHAKRVGIETPAMVHGFRDANGIQVFSTRMDTVSGDNNRPYMWRSTDDGATWAAERLVDLQLTVSRYWHPIAICAPDDSLVWMLEASNRGIVGSGRMVSRWEFVGAFGGRVATEYRDEDGSVMYLSPTVRREMPYNGDTSELIAGYLDNGTPEWRTLLGTLPAPAFTPPAGRGRWAPRVARVGGFC